MQKWIYTMRPRKPYSTERKGSFTVVPTYKRNFKLQHSSNKDRIDLSLVLIFIFGLFVITAIPNWLSHSNEKHREVLDYKRLKKEKAYNFLINSGKKRFENNNIFGAYSEFKLAYSIKPTNDEINQLLLESLSILCQTDHKYCEALDNLNL